MTVVSTGNYHEEKAIYINEPRLNSLIYLPFVKREFIKTDSFENFIISLSHLICFQSYHQLENGQNFQYPQLFFQFLQNPQYDSLCVLQSK